MWEDISTFIDLVKKNEFTVKSLIGFIEFYSRDGLFRLERQYNEKSLRIIIGQVFDFRIEKANKMIDRMYDEYTEQCQKGVPYNERVKLVSQEKIDKINQYILDLKEKKKKFIVTPLVNYYKFGDFESMKMIGIRAFIDNHFEDAWSIRGAY